MALDPSIIMAGLRNQNVGEDIMQGMQFGQQMAAQRQQMALQRQAMEDSERKNQEQSTYNSVLARVGNDPGAVERELRLRSMGGMADKYVADRGKYEAENRYKNAQADREAEQTRKDEADRKRIQAETALKTTQWVGMLSKGTMQTWDKGDQATAQRAWDMGLSQAERAGMDISAIPRQYDRNFAETLYNGAISAEKRLEADLAADREKNVDKRHGETLAVAKRGQDMTNARAGQANAIAAQGNLIKGETDIRKEYADLPEVKNYKAAYPSFAAVQKAASGSTPQSDINLIYGIAKLYDPTSVVREGEYNTIANSQAIPEAVKGWAQRIAGGGRLTPETKSQLVQEAKSRIETYEGEYLKAQNAYAGIAQQRGLNPSSIFQDVGRVSKTGEVKTGDTGQAKTQEQPRAATPKELMGAPPAVIDAYMKGKTVKGPDGKTYKKGM